ncbi:LysE family transporter [Dongia deserti]|uniref:LysE family transporter n=1 Tax=Dongia deserti TaxID=2268030 RepID=UPI000E6473C4|nr:LysE family transporter [Dongia deserti]
MTDFSLSQGVSVLTAFAAVHLLVAASPGPAFLAVSRTAISNSRSAGVIAAAAMATGALIWAVATFFGLHLLFAQAPWLYDAMRLGGAAYLIYLGVGMLREAWRGGDMSAESVQLAVARRATFLRCLAVQLSNPKAAVFFGSIFVTLLPVDAPLWLKGAALAILAMNEFGWYALVALVLSAPRARRIYSNAKRGLDALFGGFLTALGVKLALSR